MKQAQDAEVEGAKDTATPTVLESDSQSGRPSHVTTTQTTGASSSPEAAAAELADAATDCPQISESFVTKTIEGPEAAATQIEATGRDDDDNVEDDTTQSEADAAKQRAAAIVKQAEAVHAQVTTEATASQDIVDLPDEVQPRG